APVQPPVPAIDWLQIDFALHTVQQRSLISVSLGIYRDCKSIASINPLRIAKPIKLNQRKIGLFATA
ncbi:hypothetical protein, partial [Variovorax sp. PvP013]|uniref:hypothetical protein n=1 Tax=Variovorax sp. PvP013 TaxID=3156435 RepID=UPI003D1B3EC0